MKKAYLFKRTFRALKLEKNSVMRKKWNENSVDSEYMPSYKYILKWTDKNNINHERQFRTKIEALEFADSKGLKAIY